MTNRQRTSVPKKRSRIQRPTNIKISEATCTRQIRLAVPVALELLELTKSSEGLREMVDVFADWSKGNDQR